MKSGFVKKMKVNNIILENFRNYGLEKINLSDGKNVFYGFNGQGKTNIIEALYYFCTCKSFRSVHDREVIKFGSNYAHTKIEFEARKRINSAEIYIEEKKSVKLNGINLEKQSELIGAANMVIFTPEHLNLIREGPGVRRNFLDVFISQIKPLYFKNLLCYYKILKQRNNVLKSKNKKMLSTIDIWNEKLAQYAVSICSYREEALKIIESYVKQYKEENEKLNICYVPNIKGDFKDKNTIIKQLESGLERDIEKGITMTGPHRDDFDVLINGRNLKKYGSQGQTRTGVLVIKLAECEIIKDITGEEPLLLLDDILSELDVKRRKFFTDSIEKRQVIITCTDREFVKDKNANFFHVENGKVKQVG